ncbi:MAG: RnfABCDGE type electron transport complex subunit G [Marinifilaceae bacterium]|jgi:electron transport complex protein RnfG|nr:RnfABCDGE type electron transport complex subunit G [Marinifilaceae bacterium]
MGAKIESNFKNMVLVLFVVTLVAASALGGLYELTKEPIENAKLAKKLKAINQVVPKFDNDPAKEIKTIEIEGKTIEFYPAKLNGKLVGTAVKTFTSKGFSGDIWLMVGFTPDGNIYNYSILEHKETPGLGTKMVDWFKPVDPSKVELTLCEKIGLSLGLISKEEENSSQSDNPKVVIGKNPSKCNFTVSKDGGEIEAITAATISSRAFLDAIQKAYDQYVKLQKEGGQE